MASDHFLLEIGLEEMPARFVTDAMKQLKTKVVEWLEDKQLSYEAIEAFSTPRRLAVRINGLAEGQETRIEEARGPSKKIALDENGEWTKAALGFAKGQGVEADFLYFKEQKDTEYVFAKKELKGKATSELLLEMPTLIKELHFPKNMRWGTHSLRYVRPIHWIVALFGTKVIPFEITGVESDRYSYGHRFLGGKVEFTDTTTYEENLLREYVIVDPNERKDMIRRQLKELAEEQNWHIPIEESLLEEVNNLVEYPTALFGTFDEDFLELPAEVLITSMKEHQRYFPVENQSGKLLPHFVTVRNGDSNFIENVKKGNEKVLRARLSDAKFFYEEDQKQTPDEAARKLDNIVFQEDLGTIGDKVRRFRALSKVFGESINLEPEKLRHLDRAADLSKFDLVTLMVDEFTELQGLMGEKYALLAGENEVVAHAIKEHYQPKYAGDAVPDSLVGAILALAEKLDTITACFSIGLIPTGSQDPYGLRRQAAGIVHILLKHRMHFRFDELIDRAIDVLEKAGIPKESRKTIKKEVLFFLSLRLKNILMERSVRYDIADAILEDINGQASILVNKAEYLHEKLKDPDFKDTVEALSRVTNIASKAKAGAANVNTELFKETPEKELFKAYTKVKEELPIELENGNIEMAYNLLKELKPSIDNYFDHVMVMDKDETIKENRLAQMNILSHVIHSFANFQKIVFSS